MNFRSTFFLTAFLLPLTACSFVEIEQHPKDPTSSHGSSSSVSSIRETQNVQYSGVIEPAGISIYQQGSHRLSLPGGKFILLESDVVSLDQYVDASVTVYGSLRPTVEAGGMIMSVAKVTVHESSSSSSSSFVFSSSISSSFASSEESQSSYTSSYSSSAHSASSEIFVSSSVQSSTSSAALSSSQATSSVSVSGEFDERIDVMAQQDYSAEEWKFQYCTSHIGFCIPAHRNWWWKSFGTTSDTLWHVEFSSEPIEALGDGPIVLELLAGDVPSSQDGTIEVSGNSITAIKSWTFGRHFVLRGDVRLEAAIQYMIDHIEEYSEDE